MSLTKITEYKGYQQTLLMFPYDSTEQIGYQIRKVIVFVTAFKKHKMPKINHIYILKITKKC